MIGLLFVAASLFGRQTPDLERQNKLAPHFEPRPGKVLEVDRLSMLEHSIDPSKMKGTIWVTPPKGQCLIIRSDLARRDKSVCKRSPVQWSIDDLNALGVLKLQVLTQEEWDEGTALTWDTHFRMGNFVEAGDKDSGNFSDILIKSCTATEIDGDRSILLQSYEGRRFRFTLPQFDKPVRAVDPDIPNLIVNIDTKKNADGSTVDKKSEVEKKAKEDAAKNSEHGAASPEPSPGETGAEGAAPKEAKKTGGSVLGALLFKGYKAEVVEEVIFRLPPRGSYKAESGLFTETGSPKGMNGECRYMFKNAPGDPKSGAIECHDTDTLDKVYVHVTCFSQLKERRAPRAEGKKR